MSRGSCCQDRPAARTHVSTWAGFATGQGLTAPELLAVLGRVGLPAANETAHRALSGCEERLRCTIATDPGRSKSFARVERCFGAHPREAARTDQRPPAVGELLRNIDRCKGVFVTGCALRFARIRPTGRPSPSAVLSCDARECDRRGASPHGLPSARTRPATDSAARLGTRSTSRVGIAMTSSSSSRTSRRRYLPPTAALSIYPSGAA